MPAFPGFYTAEADTIRTKSPLRPGAGSIDWPQLMRALMAAHYGGAWDIEIICPPERCREEYGQAYHFLTSQIQPAAAPLSAR